MGHDHQESSSSGAVAAIVVAVLLVGIIGLLAVAGLFWMKTARVQSQAVTQSHTVTQSQAVASKPPDPRLKFEVTIDREGNTSVDGEGIDLDELRARLAKLKDETSNAFLVRINADPECPAKLLTPVLDVCEEVGDIDFRVASSGDSDSTPDEGDAR